MTYVPLMYTEAYFFEVFFTHIFYVNCVLDSDGFAARTVETGQLAAGMTPSGGEDLWQVSTAITFSIICGVLTSEEKHDLIENHQN